MLSEDLTRERNRARRPRAARLRALAAAGLLWPLVASCFGASEPPLDSAVVIVSGTSVRAEPTSSSRTLFRLTEGDRVSILEKNLGWYRVLDAQQFEGWMEESTLMLDSALERMQEMLAEAAGLEIQNTATTLDATNLRLDPGRDTTIIRRLRPNTALEVLDRATTPRPDSPATDAWLMVRAGGDQIGWVYEPLVSFSTPGELVPFTEERIYAAVRVLRELNDPEAGPVRWYVIGERRRGAAAEVAYDGIRVFTWNERLDRYETTLRLRDLRGVYPILITGTDPAGFRYHVLDAQGVSGARTYQMRGTVPREVPSN